MNTYPRDEFDDIEENSSRRGAYRGRVADTSTSRAGLLAIVISGTLALLVGGFMYVMSPRTAGPGTVAASAGTNTSASATETASASASATESATATAEASPSTNPASVKVAVYNSSAPEGSAGAAAAILQKADYEVTEVANWSGNYAAKSMVHFATGASSEANEIADMLGIPYIDQDFQAETGKIYVVLGEDYSPKKPTNEPEEAGATPSSAANPATENQTFYVYDPASGSYVVTTREAALAAGQTLYVLDPATGTYVEYSSPPVAAGAGPATGNAQRYSFDPATGTYVLDPAGAYVYNAATGTYQQG